MELTIESALSPGGLLGNLSYILLIVSMAMRDIFWLRVLAIFSGLTGIAYDVVWLQDPVGTFWETCFTLVNLIQWGWLVYERQLKHLTPEQASLRDEVLPHMSAQDFRRLIDSATSRTFAHGDTLLNRGDAVTEVYLVRSGEAAVVVDDVQVSSCLAGDFIGEIGFFSNVPASATVIALTALQCTAFDAGTLRRFMARSVEFERGFTVGLNANLAVKLVRNNEVSAAV